MKEAKLIVRERTDSSPKPGLRSSWVEYQVKVGRKIVARCGSATEAKKWAVENNIKLST